MIMANHPSSGASMPQSTAHAAEGEQPMASAGGHGAGRLLQNRLELVEDLWETVLQRVPTGAERKAAAAEAAQ